jgi:hypothetical protein
MKKRLLSIFLVLCILFTQLPGTAFAADDSSVSIDALLDLSSAASNVNCITESGHSHDNNRPCWAWYTDGVEVDGKTYTGNVLVLDGANIESTTYTTGIALPDKTTVVTVAGSVNTVTAAENQNGDITLEVAGSGGTFNVSAKEGFTPGGAYRLTLGDGLTFAGKENTIRSCEFTIKREEVFEIEFNESLKYIHMSQLPILPKTVCR